jgi:hypothetical protein
MAEERLMKQVLTGWVLAGALLAGCQATAGTGNSQLTVKPVSQSTVTRTLNLHVTGPLDLAAGGKILNDAGGAILTDAGAGVIAAGSANVVAAGGGNVIAPGGANFRIQAVSTDSFASVSKAHVQLFTLDGKKEGTSHVAGEDGRVTVKAKDGKPLLAVSMFKVDGKIYRVAALVATGEKEVGVEIDPINTMVETRVRQIVGANEKLTPVTFDKLKKVWMICNNAGITVAKEDLDTSLTPEESMARLTKLWQEAIDAKVTTQADKDLIKGFMGELAAAVK